MINKGTQPNKRTHNTSRLAKTLLASAIALTINSNTSFAAAPDEKGFIIEEIIVTARKRTESIQDVPVAITAIPKSVIADGNLDSMREFMAMVPNVSLPTDSWTSSDISIRGSGRSLQAEDPSVGIYRDGVYIGGLLTSFANFYDIESFEVLRGPQAGLYGRNAVGGALNINSTRPSFEEHNGYLEAQLGNNELQEYRGASNLTLIDDVLAIRLSGLYIDQGEGFNYVENQDKYLDAHENKSARARILYTPSEDLEFLTTLEGFSTKGNILQVLHAPDKSGLVPVGSVGIPASAGGFESPATDPDHTSHLNFDAPLMNESSQLQFVQEVNWDVGGGTLTGVYSYRDTEAETRFDNDNSIHDLATWHYDSSQESNFAEIRWAGRVNKLNITTGVTYLDENLTLDNDSQVGGQLGDDIAFLSSIGVFGPAPEGGVATGGWLGDYGDAFPTLWTNDQTLESIAVFLEASYAVSNELDVWFNVRYTEDTKTIEFSQRFDDSCWSCDTVYTNAPFNPGGASAVVALESEETFDNVSPAIGLNYAFDEDLMVYAKYVTGFKAGGFNDLASRVDLIPFDSEETEGFEVGMKSQWWDNRLQLNVALFTQERTDALISIPDPGMPGLNDYGINAGEIESKGWELELQVMPLEGLNFMLALGYLDSEFTKFQAGDNDYSGNQVPDNFKYSVNSVINYTYPLKDNLDLFTYASYHSGRDGYENAANSYEMDTAETVDLRIGVKTASWKLSAFVDNALDNRYLSYNSDPANTAPRGVYTPGRTYGLQAKYNFH